MTKPIIQSVTFAASAPELYKMYLDPKRHAAFTGGKVKISAKPGSAFSAFDGMLAGTMLWTIPDQLIVQRWRSNGWQKSDADSISPAMFWNLVGSVFVLRCGYDAPNDAEAQTLEEDES